MRIDELQTKRQVILTKERLQIGKCRLISKEFTRLIWIVMLTALVPVSAWVSMSLASVWDRLPIYGKAVPFFYITLNVCFLVMLIRNTQDHEKAVYKWELKRVRKLDNK